MEKVRKTFFDPLASSKAAIQKLLEGLPAGSAHPYSPNSSLLCRTNDGIEEIDISSYPEDFFFNAVDLGEMGEILLRRMAGFKQHLECFDDFQIMQAPASTFRVPIVSGQITILAVSERTPTYYDFCFADAQCNACCWLARDTFPGITHSGDILNNQDLLDYVRINKETLTDEKICVFISGYQITRITRFLGTHPALLVADHVDKILYIVPVPLDAATIGDATICCPLVIKRDGDHLICSILPKATTDRDMMCHSNKLESPCFPEAIKRADFTIAAPATSVTAISEHDVNMQDADITEQLQSSMKHDTAVITTNPGALPPFFKNGNSQIIKFGTGLEFVTQQQSLCDETSPSVVLPCIFGEQMQGPVLLATGKVPSNVPFQNDNHLREYYTQLKSVVVVANDLMTDNARNLASSYRLNTLFIVQTTASAEPGNKEELLSLLNSTNINAVTALAGPQALVVVQILDKYYFYRGLANPAYINTSKLDFGSDVTSAIESAKLQSLIDPRVQRLVNLNDENPIMLPMLGKFIKPQDLQDLFGQLSINEIHELEMDISAAVPQLQSLLNQKDLHDLSKDLVSILSAKLNDATAPMRKEYLRFLTEELKMDDPESMRKKDRLLGDLRKATNKLQRVLQPVITSLANMMSSQMTSKRTHDLQRLVRQAKIQSNVEAVQTMTFEKVAEYLENYAADMGVMLLNIETTPYLQVLGNLQRGAIDVSSCCELDSRILHLQGLDAGIIMEQSQNQHHGPLQSQVGPAHPILAMPYLSQGKGDYGSMLAWVCWDEFVNLESPYTVRWMEKCNEPHIAALRIIARDTLTRATASRVYNFQPASPEIGQLMSALLMAAMSKLAAMRTTVPAVSDNAHDTVTKLMRGLFGNLLTVAGSGVRPLSMVWQLFGLNPQWEVPKTETDWAWYETVVSLYPYTGWPRETFYDNLEMLLNKAIARVVTKAEDMNEDKVDRAADMVRFCKLRNIQLEHSRTIITIFMKMLTTTGTDIAAVAARLLAKIPQSLERQTQSYTRMIRYLEHLATGGQRRLEDDLIAASVFTKRAAAFADVKNKVASACADGDWLRVKESCQELLNQHKDIATLWQVNAEKLKVQNMAVYEKLLKAAIEQEANPAAAAVNHELTRQALNDAERWRLPWQIGKEGQFGDRIEPLDEMLVQEVLSNDSAVPLHVKPIAEQATTSSTALAEVAEENEFTPYNSLLQPRFFKAIEKSLTPEEACRVLNIPVTTMRVFVEALNPQFDWNSLGHRLRAVMLDLLKYPKDPTKRAESCPVKRLLDLDHKMLLIEG